MKGYLSRNQDKFYVGTGGDWRSLTFWVTPEGVRFYDGEHEFTMDLATLPYLRKAFRIIEVEQEKLGQEKAQ